MIKNAQKKIVLIHPYYYPVKKFENAVIDALNRGVMVELYTSAKRDQPVYRYMKNQSLMKNLINNGCKVYEIHEKLLHMKAYEIDNKHYSIGSFNNDRWSWKINNEANINIYNDIVETSRIKPLIDEVHSMSKEIQESQGKVGPIRYAKIQFWELFLYLSELIMSKNKYVRGSYKYINIYNDWDDPCNTDF